jgi:hypothetical protein
LPATLAILILVVQICSWFYRLVTGLPLSVEILRIIVVSVIELYVSKVSANTSQFNKAVYCKKVLLHSVSLTIVCDSPVILLCLILLFFRLMAFDDDVLSCLVANVKFHLLLNSLLHLAPADKVNLFQILDWKANLLWWMY